ILMVILLIQASLRNLKSPKSLKNLAIGMLIKYISVVIKSRTMESHTVHSGGHKVIHQVRPMFGYSLMMKVITETVMTAMAKTEMVKIQKHLTGMQIPYI